MRYKFIPLLFLLLSSLDVYAQYLSGAIGQSLSITLIPETESRLPYYVTSSAVWKVQGGYDTKGIITFHSIDKNATVRINSYFEGTITISCRYQIKGNDLYSLKNKVAYWYITCSSPDPTSIGETETGNCNDDNIYNLKGKKVTTLRKRQIYVKNGKKFFVK